MGRETSTPDANFDTGICLLIKMITAKGFCDSLHIKTLVCDQWPRVSKKLSRNFKGKVLIQMTIPFIWDRENAVRAEK